MNKKLFLVAPFAIVSLILAIITGLLRMGWNWPVSVSVAHHGALMVGSFLGTVIILERVVALKMKALYAFPILSGISGIIFLVGQPVWAIGLLIVASTGLVIIYLIIIKRYHHFYFYIMMVGAISWLIGNIYLLRLSTYALSVPWWMAFILLTVFGERLELSKFMPPRRFKFPLMWGAIIIYIAGLILPFHLYGSVVNGMGLILLSLWLLNYDIITKSIKATGIHRYTATLLGMGYFWLLIAGFLLLFDFRNPMMYDAVIHSFFIGFTFSMIFAHGPIIFPGVAGFPFKPFHKILYLWGILLQLSLIWRIIGDALNNPEWRMIGGLLNGVIILAYFISLVILMRREKVRYEER